MSEAGSQVGMPCWRLASGRVVAGLAVVAAVAALTGCAPTGTDRSGAGATTTVRGGVAVKQVDGGLRTDLQPLTKRFPALGTPVDAHWASGTVGSDRVPGPSTYWIDAVVTLAPATAQTLRGYAASGPAALAPGPSVIDLVRPYVPSGSLKTSADLSRAVAAQGWSVTAYLVDGTDVLVFTGVGDH